jgi:CheY-like chemotaxis protein
MGSTDEMHCARILVLDDSLVHCKAMAAKLQTLIVACHVDTTCEPLAPPGYDVYIVDNEFDGKECAQELVRSIKMHSPSALIILCSSSMDYAKLSRAMNKGADAIIDKTRYEDFLDTLEIITEYLNALRSCGKRLGPISQMNATVRSIREVISQWSAHMESQK